MRVFTHSQPKGGVSIVKSEKGERDGNAGDQCSANAWYEIHALW